VDELTRSYTDRDCWRLVYLGLRCSHLAPSDLSPSRLGCASQSNSNLPSSCECLRYLSKHPRNHAHFSSLRPHSHGHERSKSRFTSAKQIRNGTNAWKTWIRRTTFAGGLIELNLVLVSKSSNVEGTSMTMGEEENVDDTAISPVLACCIGIDYRSPHLRLITFLRNRQWSPGSCSRPIPSW
jgi:hypothetical protein